MLETILSFIIFLVMLVGTGFICLLSAHKEEIWEVVYERFILIENGECKE